MRTRSIIAILIGTTTAVFLLIAQQQIQAAPQASNYYVCDCQTNADGDCVAGNDGNSGTDPNSPWQTYEHARLHFNSSIHAGDEILFCQGGAFDLGNSSGMWLTSNCTAVSPCVLADYAPPWASGDEKRPILWKTTDGHAFELSNGGNAIHDEGYTFRNLDMRCPGCTANGGWGFFFYNDVNDVLIENVSIDSFAIGIHLAGSNPCAGGDTQCNGQHDRVTIRNVSITNNYAQGILGGANELLIENSTFIHNGSGTVFEHNIYISGGNGIVIRNNELYQASLDGSGNCGGTSLVAHGTLADVLVEGNYVHEDMGKANQTCWGIALSAAYEEPESFTNVTIRGNRVENVGNVAIVTSSCITCTIENNVVMHEQGFGVTAVLVPDDFTGPGDAVSSNITIRNNSIAVSGGSGIRLLEGSGHTVVSNAIEMTGMDSNWDCFDLPLSAANYNMVDHNVCGFAAGEWANGVGNLAAWQALGWGTNSQASNPGFVSTTNLRPASETAVIIQAGHPSLSSATDFDGNARPTPPAAGAYEWLTLDKKVWLPMIVTP